MHLFSQGVALMGSDQRKISAPDRHWDNFVNQRMGWDLIFNSHPGDSHPCEWVVYV